MSIIIPLGLVYSLFLHIVWGMKKLILILKAPFIAFFDFKDELYGEEYKECKTWWNK